MSAMPRLVKPSPPPFTDEQTAWIEDRIRRERSTVAVLVLSLKRILRSVLTDLDRLDAD